MTRQDKLNMLILFSAIESWSFSLNSRLPDFMHERLAETMQLLEKEVLDGSFE